MSRSQPTLFVRPGRPEDAATLTLFNLRLAAETEHKRLDPIVVTAGVRAALEDPSKARYFVAEADAGVVGCCMVTSEWSDWRNGWLWWLQSVYVHPEHRRQGVFRTLMDSVELAAREEGAVGLRLYVENQNLTAIDTYTAVGLADAGYRVMEKSLR